MTIHRTAIRQATARKHLLVSTTVGLLVALVVCAVSGSAIFAALAAWDSTVLVYGCWVWLAVWSMGANETKSHAVRENPGRALADALLIFASIASVAAVIILITHAGSSTGIMKSVEITLGLVSVVLSWGMVHTIFMLTYARLYYGPQEGGVNFNESSAPCYIDFAYLAFTLGMTFQVSDTSLQTKAIRSTALKHALLSYFFGTVIIATTINTLASLSK
jgi:uncharacterized membrane protein